MGIYENLMYVTEFDGESVLKNHLSTSDFLYAQRFMTRMTCFDFNTSTLGEANTKWHSSLAQCQWQPRTNKPLAQTFYVVLGFEPDVML